MGARQSARGLAVGLAPREDLVRAACQGWTARLDDAARRSTLLRYSDAAGGGLDLAFLGRRATMDLLRGDTVALLYGADRDSGRVGEGLRRLYDLALENREEHGVDTLHVALGMATWRAEAGGSAPLAPVALLPVEIVDLPDGRSGAIRRTGELAWNPVLAHVLETDHRCSLERLGRPEEARAPLPDGIWQIVRELASEVPGFRVQGRIALGHFFVHHAHLLGELRGLQDAAADHDVIAAMAGDEGARARLLEPARIARGEGVRDAGGSCVVLPADQTQRRAVDAACRGESCIVEGAPGSGKSQTIANIAAALVAQGERVLVVAQKRAALEAVGRRLEAEGLGALTLDLARAESSPEAVLERVAQGVAARGPAEPPEGQGLDRRRQVLVSGLGALHRERSPSGLSLLDMQSRLQRLPQEVRNAGLPPLPGLAAMRAGVALHVGRLLEAARDLGGLLGAGPASPWAAARLPDEPAAIAAVDLSLRVSELWRRMLGALAGLKAALPAAEPTSLGEVERLAELLSGVQETLRRYRPEVFDRGGPGGSPSLRVRSLAVGGGRRALTRELSALRRDPGRLRDQEARADAAAITAQAERWQAAFGARTPALAPEIDALFAALEELRAPLHRLLSLLGRGEPEFADLPLADAGRLLRRLGEDAATAHRIPRAVAIARELEGHGAWQAAREIFSRGLDPALWRQAFEHLWLTACLETAKAEEPGLPGLLGRDGDQLRERLFRLEAEEMALAAGRVRAAHRRRVARAFREHPGQAAIVQRATADTTVRDLLAAAPDVLLALFPCWLISPYAVSRLVDGDRRHFDVVLFDEASQLSAEAAIPALLRAARPVLAGDPRQLPPGDPAALGSGLARDPAREGGASILESLAFLPAYRLGWHYRSLDEALFAFSNRHIYRDAVLTFPGRHGHGAGLTQVLVPRRAAGDDGAGSAADDEAQAVADLVLRHVREHPEESLGVIARDPGRARAILAAVEGAREGQGVAALFDRAGHERFFVKHLDLAQGDERDAVILALGLEPPGAGDGPWSSGPYAGPLGERRLNVAITRARSRLTVVSACGYEEIAEERPRGRGAGLLRQFLQFAAMRHGRQMAAELTDEPVNPFEEEISLFPEDVCSALRQAGVDCVPQHGSLRHRLDLAARHPDRPGEYLLAIVCDGAERHWPPSEREYDRQRQLERLGWRVHRIFAGDWAADRDGEIARAVGAYRTAAEAVKGPSPASGRDR